VKSGLKNYLTKNLRFYTKNKGCKNMQKVVKNRKKPLKSAQKLLKTTQKPTVLIPTIPLCFNFLTIYSLMTYD
jgi:hypothetical protein